MLLDGTGIENTDDHVFTLELQFLAQAFLAVQ